MTLYLMMNWNNLKNGKYKMGRKQMKRYKFPKKLLCILLTLTLVITPLLINFIPIVHAASGTIYGTIVKNGWRLEIDWSESAQNSTSNTSTVTANVYWHSLGSSYIINSTATKTGTTTINGTPFNWSGAGLAGLTGNQRKLIASNSLSNIGHNADGSLAISISSTFNCAVTLSGTLINSVSASGTATLDDFVRPPANPSSVSVGNFTQNSMNLYWAWNGSFGPVSGYHLYLNGSYIGDNGSGNYLKGGLNPGTYYTMGVSQFGPDGASSIVTVGGYTIPANPTGVSTSNVTQTSATLNWTSMQGATSYNVYKNGSLVASGLTGTSYNFTGLTPNTGYTLSVAAVNSSGASGQTSFGSSTLPNVPSSPTGLSSTGITQNSATLSWASTSGATSYDVYLNGNYIGNTTSLSYNFTGLSTGTSYNFGVAAVNAGGTSVQTSSVVTTLPTSDLGIKPYFSFGSSSIGSKNETLYVNEATGNVVLNAQDESLFTKGVQGFTFNRTYNSKSDKISMLGKGWTFTGNENLKKDPLSGNVSYFDESGTESLFLKNGDGTYAKPNGSYLALTSATVNGTNGFKITDKNQFVKNFEVNPTNGNTYRLYSYNDKYGNEIRFTYNANGQLIKIAEIGSTRKSIDFTYDTGKIYATYSNHKMTYEVSNNLLTKATLSATDGNGVELANKLTTQYQYDGNGQLMKVIDPKANETQISYQGNTVVVNKPATATSSAEVTNYGFDPAQNTCTVGDTVYTRDSATNSYAINKITDGTEITDITHDANFNVTETKVTKDGTVSSDDKTTFDSNGNVLTQTDKDNKTSTFEYDSLNRLTKSTDTSNKVTTYSYTGNSAVTATSGTETTLYEYDTYGRTSKVTYPNGTYDVTTYDGQGPLSQRVTDKDGNYVTTIFTDFGNVAGLTDKAGRTTAYTYDPLFTNQILTVTDGLGKVTTYTYDTHGNLFTLKDAKNRTKSYTYNSLDQLTDVRLPVTSGVNMLLKYEYDSDGNILKTTKNSGITFENSYADSKLTSVVVKQNGTKQFETKYTYPTDTNNTNTIELLDGSGVSLLKKTFNYNDKDQLTSYTQGNYSLGYTYDDKDRVAKNDINYSEGTLSLSQNLVYDENDKVTSFITKKGATSLLSYEYIYDTPNNKTTAKVNGGLFIKEATFKSSNLLDTIKYTKQGESSPSETYSYVYDGSGNITNETSSRGESKFTYDGNNQLTKEELPGGVVNNYTYDEVGNRLTDSRNGSAHTFVYNDANQIVTKNSVAYTYDLDGNLTQDEKYKYEYNALGQQTRITTLDGTEVAKYEYDEDGLRTKKIVANETHEYYYESGNLTLEIVRDTGVIKQYRYYQWDNAGIALGMIIREKDGSGNWVDTPYHFWTNHRGDVTTIVDNAGNEVGSYTFDAYGNVLSVTGTIAEQNSIRYASYYYDSETGHYYLKARYYNPENGNFLALDPHPGDSYDPISQNGYTYANNNPVLYVDPTGMFYVSIGNIGKVLSAIGMNPLASIIIGMGLYKLRQYILIQWGNLMLKLGSFVGGAVGWALGVIATLISFPTVQSVGKAIYDCFMQGKKGIEFSLMYSRWGWPYGIDGTPR